MEHAHKIHVLMRSALHETSAQDTIYSNVLVNSKNIRSCLVKLLNNLFLVLK